MYPLGVVCKHSLGILYFMTRLERLEAELKRELDHKVAAIHRNDVMWLAHSQPRIDKLKEEIEDIKRNRTTTLKSLLDGKSDEFKNRFYKSMLRISLLSDVVNEACEIVRTMFKNELGVSDFSLRKEVEDMRHLSQKIASFALSTNDKILEDCIVDNSKFVDHCITLADLHLKEKLKL